MEKFSLDHSQLLVAFNETCYSEFEDITTWIANIGAEKIQNVHNSNSDLKGKNFEKLKKLFKKTPTRGRGDSAYTDLEKLLAILEPLKEKEPLRITTSRLKTIQEKAPQMFDLETNYLTQPTLKRWLSVEVNGTKDISRRDLIIVESFKQLALSYLEDPESDIARSISEGNENIAEALFRYQGQYIGTALEQEEADSIIDLRKQINRCFVPKELSSLQTNFSLLFDSLQKKQKSKKEFICVRVSTTESPRDTEDLVPVDKREGVSNEMLIFRE